MMRGQENMKLWYQHIEIMTVSDFLQIARVQGATEEEEGSSTG
jgi:hypothetical protein